MSHQATLQPVALIIVSIVHVMAEMTIESDQNSTQKQKHFGVEAVLLTFGSTLPPNMKMLLSPIRPFLTDSVIGIQVRSS